MKPSLLPFLPWGITYIVCIACAAIVYSVSCPCSERPIPSAPVSNLDQQVIGNPNAQKSDNHEQASQTTASVSKQLKSQENSRESDSQSADKQKKSPFRYALCNWLSEWSDNRTIALFTIVLAAVSAFQAFVYFRQWHVMNETKEQSLRAYVSVRLKSISNFNTTKSAVFIFECINHGQTPAKDVEFHAIMGLTKANPSELPAIGGDWNPKRMDLFPNSQATNDQRTELNCDCKKFFTAEEIKQIKTQSHFVYIGLEIQYWDVFGRGHQTQAYYLMHADQNALAWLTYEPNPKILEALPIETGQIGFTVIPGTSKFS